MRSPLLLAVLTLVACASSPTPPKDAGGADLPASAEAEQAEAEGQPGTKVEQCERLGTLIERTETGRNIVNVNDRGKMDELADRRRAAADEAAAMTLAEAAVVSLRDRYVQLLRAMAQALSDVASADKTARHAAVQKHGELDAQITDLVDELNTACGAQ